MSTNPKRGAACTGTPRQLRLHDMKASPIPKTVLVTGCSSGIGAATARLLRDRGWAVFPTARKEADLEALRADGFDPVALDVADSQSVKRAAADVLERTGNNLGALVNNAGFGQPGALEDLSRDAMRYQFEVNLFGLQELTNQFIPHWREREAGRVVNVSSVVGRIALPLMGAYSGSKFALEAFSDVLRVELVDTGIAVSLIEPGPIISSFRTNAVDKMEAELEGEDEYGKLMEHEIARRRRKPNKTQSWTVRPPEAVGEKVIHALESSRPRRRYCVTPPAYLGAWMRRLAPYSMIDAILRQQVRKKRAKLTAE